MLTQHQTDSGPVLVNDESGTYVLGTFDSARYVFIVENLTHSLDRSDYASDSEWHADALGLHTALVTSLADSGYSTTASAILPESYTIKALTEEANARTVSAGIELTQATECTLAHVAEWLGVYLEDVGENMPVDAESAEDFLEGHNEWVIL